MQYLLIKQDARLSDIADIVGDRNVETVLAANNLNRVPNIGQVLNQKYHDILQTAADVDPQRKSTLLNSFSGDSDIFEYAALLDESGWKILSTIDAFENSLKIPETIVLPDMAEVIGNGVHIASEIYKSVMHMLSVAPYTIDPVVFNDYSNIRNVRPTVDNKSYEPVTNWFSLPWGRITLYSSISDMSIDFPVYPEEIQDGRVANYTTMPDMLYQYEPWYLYESSGPRSNTYTFNMHRDMFTGDHRDGRANELIRFCEANCFPDYSGAAVITPTVTLYIMGEPLITGIMTECRTKWDGPIGLDGWYLHFTLELTITEISKNALNYSTVMQKPLIG